MGFEDWSNNKKKKKSSSFEEWSNANRGISKKQEEEDEKKRKAYLSRSSDNDDIAPVGGNKDSWFKSGGFSDGVDGVGDFFGDLGQTVGGTVGDLGLGIVRGAGRLVEGVVDLGTYGVAGVADLIGQDDFAKKAKKAAQYSFVDDWAPIKKATSFVDRYSVLGDKADMVSEGLGQVGAIILTGGAAAAGGMGAGGITALTTGITGLSGMGSGMGSAYESGATGKDALVYGLGAGAVEAGTELLFGGLGKGVKALGVTRGIGGLDDIFAKKLSSAVTRAIRNESVQRVAGNTIEAAIKAGGEGAEEVLSGLGSAVMKKLTYEDDETLGKLIEDENLLEQFVVGAITSSIAQGTDYVKSTKTGRDYVTGYTNSEQAVIDKEVERRVAEREKAGKKLTTREISAIEEQVQDDMEHGQLDIDTIEEVLGGDDYTAYRDTIKSEDELKAEYEELANIKKSELTTKQEERLAELKSMNLDDTTKREGLRQKLDEAVRPQLQGSRLAETYRERERKGQAFEADLTKYTGKQREAVERAVDSGVLNNTYRSHELVDVLSKIEADKGIAFDYTNNAKLKESIFAVEGKTVNGFANKKTGTVTLNVQSAKAWQSVVGHEITHVLEGTESYSALQRALYAYANMKGELETRRTALTELYSELGADVESELTADLVGDYLFTDKGFVDHLTGNRTLFQKIYDEIKYLWKVATGKERASMERVVHEFDRAWKELSVKDESGEGGNVQYSISGEKANLSEENRMDLQNAKKLKEDGVSNEEIYRKTGWYTQSDGKWRFEISDEIMNPQNFSRTGLQSAKDAEAEKYLAKAENGLRDGTISEEIYEMIQNFAEDVRNKDRDSGKLPDFLDAPRLYEAYPQLKKVTLFFQKLHGMQGYTDTGLNQIVLDPEGLHDVGQTVREGLAHEIQHIIQSIEGFTRGSTPGDAGGYEAYRKTGGEIEARDVEDRLRMTPEERRRYMPVQYSISENGESKTLYSGSPNTNIRQFKVGGVDGSRQTGDRYGRGVYLTTNQNTAKGYAGDSGKVYEINADGLNIFNLNDSITDEMKATLQRELNGKDKQFRNSVLRNFRSEKAFTDFESAERFFDAQRKLWKEEDGYYAANKPDIKSANDKTGEAVIEYTDFANIENAIGNLTGNELYDALKSISTDDFASFITGHGFDGISFDEDADNQQYVIYRNEDRLRIMNPGDDPDIRFSLSETVEETKDLVALHNLTADKLTKSLQLGGLPMPSLAITKADIPHDNFGEITLIFDKKTIDPKANKKNKVYSADAWTPTFPRVEYEADSNVAGSISKRLRSLEGKIDDSFLHDLERLQYGFEDYLNSQGGEEGLIRYVMDNYGLKAAYLEEQGKHIDKVTYQKEAEKGYNPAAADKYLQIMDILGVSTAEEIGKYNLKEARDNHGAELEAVYPGITKTAIRLSRVLSTIQTYLAEKDSPPKYNTVTDIGATKRAVDAALDTDDYEAWVRELFSGIVKDSGIYNNKDIFTPSGNRRSFKQLHLPVTLENIVKAMAGQNNGNAKNVSSFNGVKTIRAATAETFKSVDQIRQRKDRLQNKTQEEMDAILDALQSRLYKVIETIDSETAKGGEGNPYIRFDTIGEILTEIGESGKYDAAGIKQTFQQYGKSVSDEIAMEAERLLNDVSQMPVNLFEAKPERVVGFDEAAVFVIPRNADVKLKQELLNRGYSIAEYDPDVEGDRQRVVNGFEEYKFSLSNVGEEYAPAGSYSTPLRELALEDAAPVANTDTPTVRGNTPTVRGNTPTDNNSEVFPEGFAPITEEEANSLSRDYLDNLDEEDAPPEMPEPYYGDSIEPIDPFENRDMEAVGSRSVKAYMYENPEVKPFFQLEAEVMLGDLQRTTKGERVVDAQLRYDSNGESWGWGVQRNTAPDIAELKDRFGYTYDQIEAGIKAIIEDNGKENNACSKRIEFMLNDRLINGYRDFDGGLDIPANQQYINLVNEKGITEYNEEARKHFFEDMEQYIPPVEEDIAPVAGKATSKPVRLYRGFNKSQNASEKNLTQKKSVYEYIGRQNKDEVTELVPLSYYTESEEDARSYANMDMNTFDEYRQIGVREYRQNIMDGKDMGGMSESEYAEKRAYEMFRILNGGEPNVGRTEAFDYIPNKVLDLTALGSKTNAQAAYKALSEAFGISESELDDTLTLGNFEDDFPAFKLLRNTPDYNLGTRVVELAKKAGYDSIRYNEDGYNHYAIINDQNGGTPGLSPADLAPIAPVEVMGETPSPDAITPMTVDEANAIQDAKARADAAAEGLPKSRKQLHMNIMNDVKATFSSLGYDFDGVLAKAKNLSTFATVDNTPQRVMEKALGYKAGGVLADLTVNKVAQNESAGIKWLNSFTDRKNGLIAKISKQYRIKPGSRESAAAQMYAEGFYVGEKNEIIAYGDDELALDFPNLGVQERIKGLAHDPRIRRIYDETLDAINASRARNAYPEIQKLDNYFLHFRAMDDTFSKLGLPFNPNDIRAKDLPTDLNGVTADLKPGQPYFASAMHRTGKRTSFDLLGGLERYLTSAKNQIYHIDDIQTLRALRNYMADTYGQANGLEGIDMLTEEEVQERIDMVYNSHLSTFAKFLNEEANMLAGKTALIDRGLEGIIGRRGMTFLDTVNRQVGSNMVGFNISSSLTNFLPVAQTFAKTNKFDFTKAFAQTVSNKISSIFGKGDGFAENSPVIIRRKGADRFYRTPWQKAGDAGYVLMSAVDDISTELIARTKFNELTRKGMDEQTAHFETDKWVSRLMGDRSIGQQPQMFNSKTLGIFTKFQLEVRNQLDSQFYDTIQEAKVSAEDIQNGLARNAKIAAKVASTFAQLAVVQHLYGTAFESVAGYNPAFDIISTLATVFGFDDEEDSEDTVLDNVEQGFLDLLEDLPYTSTFTGGRIPISSALPVAELVKGVDQYGNEKSRLETLGEAAPYYVLPGGYGQVKKTAAGLGMFSDEHPVSGSYTDSGKLRFPVEDTPANRVQAAIFGQYASENAREYFDNDYAPLNEKQIQEYVDVDVPIREYREIREGLSGKTKLEEKLDYISGLDLPVSKKNILANNATTRKDPIDMTGYEDFSSLEEFDFANKKPDKYAFAKSVGGYDAYKTYSDELYDIKADKDASGKSISGSRKEKVIQYINNLDADYYTKIILLKSEYPSEDAYNAEIIEYLNGRGDLTYEERVSVLTELGFRVTADGEIYAD